ncbi:hypothetical protein B5V89_05180 [Heyndrickxia sporothermodurans]|uniref:Hsp20/alpha crystallin family protein n=1 Tax=Heyndrickxia TaxID=2837504 RepID=UPI000D34E9B0|nr:Hsp20/alpha crystallin family protein [Heyndrickxia sporothermodurans]PTY79530.1 hypothetical protein B5V89_05180 [Heyndrickxia sporothermodurans]
MGRKKRYHSDVKQKLGSNFSELLSEIAPFIGPRLDIYETNDTFFITADVAGIKKEDLSVKLQDKTLIIAGAIPDHFHSETVRVFSQERYYGPFQKKISLPKDCLLHQLQANLENGILFIQIPLVDHSGPEEEIVF